MNDIRYFNDEYLKSVRSAVIAGHELGKLNIDDLQAKSLSSLTVSQVHALTKSSLCVATPNVSLWMLSETQNSSGSSVNIYPADVYELNYLYLSTAKYVCAKNPKLATLTMGFDYAVSCQLSQLTKKDIKRIASSRPLLFTLSIPGSILRGAAKLPHYATRNLHLLPMLSNHHFARS